MSLVLNIRGTGGSGKSTLARSWLPQEPAQGGPVTLGDYHAPTNREPDRRKHVPGYLRELPDGRLVAVVGPYERACGGLDQVPNSDLQEAAIRHALHFHGADVVIAEGLMASGLYQRWANHALERRAAGGEFAFCYMTTPLEVCYERIRQRQREKGVEKEFKTEHVDSKFRAVLSTRAKAMAAGLRVYDLPYLDERIALQEIMEGRGDVHLAKPGTRDWMRCR